jgi:rod shape determining protein RodA
MTKLGMRKLSFFKLDSTLVVTLFFLICFGLAAIYSVALGQGRGEFLNFQKQLVWLAVGFMVMIVLANFDYHRLDRFRWIFYGIGVFLLLLVLTPLGSVIKGSKGWFDMGFFSFQPVELMKIILIIVLAGVCSVYARTAHKLRQMFLIGLIVLLPFGLVLLQPDFGSGMVLFCIWLASFFLVAKKKWHIFLVIGLIVATLSISWMFIFQDYQKARIMTFLDPSLDPSGSGYNVKQSIIAVGAGRLMGRGLGFGSQSQLKFIPESQTDFIFAVIAEEWGFVGMSFIIIFYVIIFYRLYKIAITAQDDFGLFFTLLVAALIFIHVFINVGMCVGLLPVTGISLPFVSYGGSFLVTMLVLIGIVLNINKSSAIARQY